MARCLTEVRRRGRGSGVGQDKFSICKMDRSAARPLRKPFQSDHNFDHFISPVSDPFYFEDPRALTELRPIFMFQSIPHNNPVFHGGNIEFFGTQGASP